MRRLREMSDKPELPPSHIHTTASIAYIHCPACKCHKAVIAATTYQEQLCFCPQCEHVWDCPKPR